MNDTALLERPAQTEFSVVDVRNQVHKIQELMKDLMKDGEHFGVIPGTKKPSLYKAGAEKLNFIFRLAPEYVIDRDDLPGGHREYRVCCRLRNMATGVIVGEGVGSCSTMESKYRYRNEFLEQEVGQVPKQYWDAPKDDQKARDAALVQAFGPGKYRAKKTEGTWKVYRITGDGERKENPDIADVYNTVLKMAKKRAHVDATITACAASDIFTQDVEDFVEETEPGPQPESRPAPSYTPPTTTTSAPASKPDDSAFENAWKREIAAITAIVKAVGHPDAWSKEDKDAIELSNLVAAARESKDATVLEVARLRCELYAPWRVAPAAADAARIINRTGFAVDSLKELRSSLRDLVIKSDEPVPEPAVAF